MRINIAGPTRALVLALMALAGTGGEARAVFSTAAVNTVTVQAAGPRQGASGQRFLNVEGANNNAFASFGVLDFTPPANANLTSVSSLTLRLVEANASFTAPGALNFYLTQDTMTNATQTGSPLTFQAANPPDGLGTQLTPKFLLGTGTFTSTSNGPNLVDIFTFNVGDGAATYLLNQANTGGDIRIVVAPGDATVSATYAGFANSNFLAAPQLTVVPEPASLTLMAIGVVGLFGLVARRRLARAAA